MNPIPTARKRPTPEEEFRLLAKVMADGAQTYRNLPTPTMDELLFGMAAALDVAVRAAGRPGDGEAEDNILLSLLTVAGLAEAAVLGHDLIRRSRERATAAN
jgi:hypothetical protein